MAIAVPIQSPVPLCDTSWLLMECPRTKVGLLTVDQPAPRIAKHNEEASIHSCAGVVHKQSMHATTYHRCVQKNRWAAGLE